MTAGASPDPGALYRAARPSLDLALDSYRDAVEVLLEPVPEHYVTGRVKSARSLIRKLRKDPGNPRTWESIHDKVGVRVICSTKADCAAADRVLRSGPWEEINHEVKSGEPDRLFYPGVHLTVSWLEIVDHLGGTIPCEIQIRTRAQDAWAVVSHKLDYKGAIEPPPSMKRLIHRLTVVVEMFDDEVHRLFRKRAKLPMYRTAIALEHLEDKFEELTGDPAEGSPDLSIASILLQAYATDERERFPALINDYCSSNTNLRQTIADHSVESDSYQDAHDWLFTQPEVLAVLERATNNKHLLVHAIAETDIEDIVRRTCISANLILPGGD